MPALAADGARRVAWAERSMPVVQRVRDRFTVERPLAGVRIAACLHVTPETAALVRALAAGGASVALCSSNPLSTQDDIAAALQADAAVSVHAASGVDIATYYKHIDAALDIEPQLVLDDGCDLVSRLHTDRQELLPGVVAGCEETTTGVVRLRAMAASGALRFPVVAVNDTATKRLVDNRYGTGQSTLDALLRTTNVLLAGKVVVVAGYGWCGRGIAQRAAGLGADVVVTEVDPTRALDALLEGYRVLPMADAAAIGEVFITATGNRDVIRDVHLDVMRDGAILLNAGHFDVEIDVRALDKLATGRERVRPHVDEYTLHDGRRLLLLAEGRVANLAAADGNPASVMDLAFAEQALCVSWLAAGAGAALAPGVHDVPAVIDREVAELKLASNGTAIDTLTAEQRRYLTSWEQGS
ncbi:MAG TPA: adenosylhomocysteinase [Acidothermales bacterium]|nr:adenosylhomocysteinase [Actinomycetes bacterium]